MLSLPFLILAWLSGIVLWISVCYFGQWHLYSCLTNNEAAISRSFHKQTVRPLISRCPKVGPISIHFRSTARPVAIDPLSKYIRQSYKIQWEWCLERGKGAVEGFMMPLNGNETNTGPS